jgi:hypothetical protein
VKVYPESIPAAAEITAVNPVMYSGGGFFFCFARFLLLSIDYVSFGLFDWKAGDGGCLL